MPDLNDVNDFGLRCAIDASHLGSLQRAAKEHAEFEEFPLRTHEEVARFAREHHRFVRGVDPLISERDGGPAQPLPGVLEISREILREGSFGRGPAVVLLPFLDPLLAVVALSTCHVPIVAMERVQTCAGRDQLSQSGIALRTPVNECYGDFSPTRKRSIWIQRAFRLLKPILVSR